MSCNNPGCGKTATNSCTGCYKQRYCSPQCQKDCWADHSYECKPSPPLSFDGLRQVRPTVSTPAEFEDLIEEIKDTYYPGAVSNTRYAQAKQGVPLGFITIKNGSAVVKMLAEFTEEELNRHIILILTKKRESQKKRFIAAIAGKEEANKHGTVFLGAELAPNITRVFYQVFWPLYVGKSNPRQCVDLLYGFTAAIYQYWFWMQRHPCDWDGHSMLETLASAWNSILKKSPEELGLDPVFSLPAMKQFLRQFKKDLEEEECFCSERLLFQFE